MKRYKLDNELRDLKDKDIILFGASNAGIETKKVLESYNLKIQYFCDNDPCKHGIYVEGIEVIDVNKLVYLCNKDNKRTVIIISSMYYSEIYNQLKDYGLLNEIYAGQDILEIDEFNLWEKDRELMDEIKAIRCLKHSFNLRSEFLENLKNLKCYNKNIYIVCTMHKTGTNSLSKTLEKKYKKIIFCTFHGFEYICKMGDYYRNNLLYMIKKSKIIISVRDYLGMKLSYFFQTYSEYNDVIPHSDFYDLQKMFDRLYIYNNLYDSNPKYTYSQEYLENNFQDSSLNWFNREIKDIVGVDVFDYPFDKEKGYTVINLEGGGNF